MFLLVCECTTCYEGREKEKKIHIFLTGMIVQSTVRSNVMVLAAERADFSVLTEN